MRAVLRGDGRLYARRPIAGTADAPTRRVAAGATGGAGGGAAGLADRDEAGWRERLYVVIFEADTPSGKAFDVALLAAIVASVVAVCLDSVQDFRQHHREALVAAEWLFTGLFSIEYLLRMACVRHPIRYATSFYGLVDLLSILPTYLSLIIPGSQHLLVIRILRLLRVFRVLKLGRYVSESQVLMTAIRNSRAKITVFLFSVLTIVVVIGAAMYLIEGAENGFTSIPRAMYWAIVTLTTVGYGDITPRTTVGQLVSSLLMVLGYGIIAIPTGIVTAELTQAAHPQPVTTRTCPVCLTEGHRTDAHFCRDCGAQLLRDVDRAATSGD
ncbi:MAG: ion transporter [Spirochaetaceae bacterium]|nr:ion transporter [Myxococcales bacterium]MCB9726066.1 ion transporter [Spirochaetaceae bacterium]